MNGLVHQEAMKHLNAGGAVVLGCVVVLVVAVLQVGHSLKSPTSQGRRAGARVPQQPLRRGIGKNLHVEQHEEAASRPRRAFSGSWPPTQLRMYTAEEGSYIITWVAGLDVKGERCSEREAYCKKKDINESFFFLPFLKAAYISCTIQWLHGVIRLVDTPVYDAVLVCVRVCVFCDDFI